VEKLVDSLKHI